MTLGQTFKIMVLRDFDLSTKNARFFVVKSYSEDDIHRSIK